MEVPLAAEHQALEILEASAVPLHHLLAAAVVVARTL